METATNTAFSKITSLINGYSCPIFLGNDIVNVIKRYYTFNYLNMNVFLLSYDHNRFYNITSKQLYNVNVETIPKRDRSELIKQCVANKCSLPKYIRNKLIKMSEMSEMSEYNTSNWSLIFESEQMKENSFNEDKQYLCRYSLTAFHSNLLLSLNEYIAYNVELPLFPNELSFNSASFIYNKINETLYVLHPECKYLSYYDDNNPYIKQNYDMLRYVYCLNFNDINMKWEILNCNLKYSRCHTSLCMVHNDKFISILGGINNKTNYLKKAELYAINCSKSIKLKDMKKIHRNALSIYHDKYHRIIIAGTSSSYNSNGIEMEWYDINKDEWIIIGNKWKTTINDVNGMFISEENPNILFVTGYYKTSKTLYGITNYYGAHKMGLYQIDLRAHTFECVSLMQNIELQSNKFLTNGQSDICVLHL